MFRLAALATVALFSMGSSASGATLFFQAVPTATSTCPPPCYEIRMFYEDPSRSLPLRALRFDVAIVGASVPVPSVPNATDLNADGGNGLNRSTFSVQPWNWSSVVGESPEPDYDMRVVNEADTPLTIDTVATSFVDGCGGRSCPAITGGLIANRVYLGR